MSEQDNFETNRGLRWLWTALIVLAIIVVAGAAFVLLRKHSPPRAARLLPESDGIVYVDLAAIRDVTHFDRKQITPDADYQQFEQQSGVSFERDLDEAAFAVHRVENPVSEARVFSYSEVFVGRFDRAKLMPYLQSQAQGTESYAGRTVYSLLNEGRTVRVAVLDRHTVAISNTPTTEQIHEILDRDKSFFPEGPTLLHDYYAKVPVFSFAWGLGKIEAPFTGDGNVHLFGFNIPLPTNTVFVASARYLDALHLRIDEFAPNEAVAETSAAMATAVLTFYTGEQKLRANLGDSPDDDVAQLLRTVKVEQSGDHASLTATVPLNMLRRAVTP